MFVLLLCALHTPGNVLLVIFMLISEFILVISCNVFLCPDLPVYNSLLC